MVGGPRTPHRASQLPVSGLRRPEQTPSQDGQPDPPPPPWPGPPNPASVLTQHRSPSPFPSNPKLTQGSLGPSSRPWCSADPEQQAWPWGRRREGTRPPPALTTRAASAGQVCRQVSLPEPPLRRGGPGTGLSDLRHRYCVPHRLRPRPGFQPGSSNACRARRSHCGACMWAAGCATALHNHKRVNLPEQVPLDLYWQRSPMGLPTPGQRTPRLWPAESSHNSDTSGRETTTPPAGLGVCARRPLRPGRPPDRVPWGPLSRRTAAEWPRQTTPSAEPRGRCPDPVCRVRSCCSSPST